MPNFNAVAQLVRPAERGQTDIQTDILVKTEEPPFHKSGRASRAREVIHYNLCSHLSISIVHNINKVIGFHQFSFKSITNYVQLNSE